MDWIRSEILPFALFDVGTTTITIAVPFWQSILATITAGKVRSFSFHVLST
jgi:hypothetical protein